MPTISELFERYYTKAASAEERKKLMEQVAAGEHPEELQQLLQHAWEQVDNDQAYFSAAESEQMLGKALAAGKSTAGLVPIYRVPLMKRAWLRYAAIFLLIAGAASLYYLNRDTQKQTVTTQPAVDTDRAPGGNRAILTLADGSKIVLDSAGNGTIAQQQHAQIIKLTDGQIAYNYDEKEGSDAVMLNSISTPRGGQYRLTLADGTKVWLNAASSIAYPTAFTGKRRNVTVTGEVYLEVAKDGNKPFSVSVNGATIDVLGTSFNINAYENEETVKTTLLEGAVRVSARGQYQALKPGQQVQIPANGSFAILGNLDLKQVIAWKNGYFDFNNADFLTVMRQLERWYDIDVIYKGKVPKMIFKGKMDRNVQLSDVVRFLGKFDVEASLQGRNLVISNH